MTKRINKPQHIKLLLSEQLNALRADDTLDPIQRARAMAYLSSVALTAMRDGELEERISAIEQGMKDENR